jgi:hypothetical protein
MLFIRDKLQKAIVRHNSYHSDGLLIRNRANETWMDTSYQGDTREGFRIEIQALWLCMLRLANILDVKLNQPLEYTALEDNTRDKVREVFFRNKILYDGKDDDTVRPNIFLAYYIYPDLLSNKEWESVFDNSIKKLWLEWGGFSTIQKDSVLYCSNYTGEDNRSYHRGDSWFFINNIAAVSLYKLNKEKYGEYIEKIISASTKDILSKGIIGRASELSSAQSQKAEGSLFQLWSASTYIELIDTVNQTLSNNLTLSR